MRRIRLVAAIAAVMVMMVASAVPAMADVRFDNDGHKDFEDRIEQRIENYYEHHDLDDIDLDDEYLWYWYLIDALD